MEIAHQNKDRRNIFFVHATDEESLKKAYLDIARQIGPEYLLKNYRGRDLFGIWSNETSDEKVERFKSWLDDEENNNALLIFDDVDGIRKPSQTPSFELPHQAKNVLLTTRNPNVRPRDNCKIIKLSNMETTDVITILETVRSIELEDDEPEDFPDLYNPDIILSIAKAVHGHPLAASIAMKYIIRVQSLDISTSAGRDFVSMLTGSDHKARLKFLQYKPQTQMPSIIETFLVSRERLSSPQSLAWSLMEVLSLLETDESLVDFRNFFELSDIPNGEELPDMDILGLRREGIMPLLHQIEEVSFMERMKRAKPLRVHPLWAECTRQLMGMDRIRRLMRQILKICYYSTASIPQDAHEGSRRRSCFYPHVKHCMNVCKAFDLDISDLELQREVNELVATMTA